MIVHMNLEAPFEFCGECPFKDIYKGPIEGYFYCDNAEHCGYAVRKHIESQNALGRTIEAVREYIESQNACVPRGEE